MKVVIFAGGKGTRIAEATHLIPKPMVEIGGRPILWHILKGYAAQGFLEFIICLGYKSYVIKEYFFNYFLHNSDLSIDLGKNEVTWLGSKAEPMKVTLVDTGLETQTAGRLQRVAPYLSPGEDFFLTYGDGVSDVDFRALLAFHRAHGKLATVTAIQPSSRFGVFAPEADGAVRVFAEKPKEEAAWINGGFFVLKHAALEYLPADSDDVPWERAPLETLAHRGELMAYRHSGFWRCMDTLRDAQELNALWDEDPKWKKW
jgi:glucose-1-phosphate cytidylyltransferase